MNLVHNGAATASGDAKSALGPVSAELGISGDPNVTIAISDFGPGFETTSATQSRDSSGNTVMNLNSTGHVYVDAAKGGNEAIAELAGSVTHEVTHGIQDKAAGGGPQSRSEEFGREQQAYQNQAHLANTLGAGDARQGVTQPGGVNNAATASTNAWCKANGNQPEGC